MSCVAIVGRIAGMRIVVGIIVGTMRSLIIILTAALVAAISTDNHDNFKYVDGNDPDNHQREKHSFRDVQFSQTSKSDNAAYPENDAHGC